MGLKFKNDDYFPKVIEHLKSIENKTHKYLGITMGGIKEKVKNHYNEGVITFKNIIMSILVISYFEFITMVLHFDTNFITV